MIEIKPAIDYNQELTNLRIQTLNLTEINKDTDIRYEHIKKVHNLLSNTELKIFCKNVLKNKYLENLTFEDLNRIYDLLDTLYNDIKEVKEEVDVEIFFKKGNRIDIKALKQEMRKLNKIKDYPNINFDRLKELFDKPIKKLKPQDNSSDEYIQYDEFIVRKYLIGIIQMIVNEMDLLIGFTGGEGLAKSTGATQDINLIYYLLKEIGIIDYEYDIKEMFFNNLDDFLQAEDKYFHNKFRILGLDEGNELNKQNWQEENVKMFFQRLRRERHNQRIKFICLPQLGEMITNITLGRMNFIFEMKGKTKSKTYTIDKGYCNFYVVPRDERGIYSPHNRRIIKKVEIIDVLGNNLEDKKKFLKEIPDSILVKKFKRNHIWGFDRKKYLKFLKDTNQSFSVSKGLKVTELEAYYIYKYLPELKHWGVDWKENKSEYSALHKLRNRIIKHFENDPKKLESFELRTKRKAKEKEMKEVFENT